MSVVTFVLSNWDLILAVLSALLTVASLVTKFTASPKDDEVVRKIIAFLSFLQPKDAPGTVKLPGTKPALTTPSEEAEDKGFFTNMKG